MTSIDFIEWYPERSAQKYELHDGTIVTMPKPKGKHSQIAGLLMNELGFEIEKLGLPYFIPKESIVKLKEFSGYEPDAIVLKKEAISNEPRWEKESTIISDRSIQLIIEVTSTNWRVDRTCFAHCAVAVLDFFHAAGHRWRATAALCESPRFWPD